jgi:hypothetical protein
LDIGKERNGFHLYHAHFITPLQEITANPQAKTHACLCHGTITRYLQRFTERSRVGRTTELEGGDAVDEGSELFKCANGNGVWWRRKWECEPTECGKRGEFRKLL